MNPEDIVTTEDFDKAVIDDTLRKADQVSDSLDQKTEAMLDTYRIPFVDLSVEPPPVEWIVQDWIQKGDIVLLAGRAGGGKSTTAAELAVAAAGARNGQGWLGIPVPEMPVLYLDEEAGEAEIRRQFYRHDGIGNKNLFVASCQGFRLDDPETLRRIQFEIQTKGIQLMILDTVSHFFANADENSSKDVGGLFLPLFELRDKYGLTTVMLHHLRKINQNASSEDILERVRGSTAYTTQPSAVWGQMPVNNGAAADLQVLKRRGGGPKPIIRIEYHETNGKTSLCSIGHPNQLESDLDRAIHTMSDALRKSTQEIWTTSDIIYLGSDFPKRTAERALKTLTDIGVIRRVARGKYICDNKIKETEADIVDTDAPNSIFDL
jgi:energy-coupling factor transporter ATP-binding protein EcfA2